MAERQCLLTISGAFQLDGGIAAVNRLVIHALAEKGYRLDILALCEEGASIDRRYSGDVPVRYRSFRNNKARFSWAVWRAVLSGRYDLVLADLVNIAFILSPLARLRHLRYVVWLFGVDVFPPRPDREGRIGLKYAWKRLAISDYTKSQVVNHFPNLPIEVCELALDPFRHATANDPQAGPDPGCLALPAITGETRPMGNRVILNVARMAGLGRSKGQEVLIRAWPEVCGRFPEAQLLLVGDGPGKPHLLSLARLLPASVQERIFLPGHLDDQLLDRLYRHSFLFAMPSVGEGFGLVYLEAMSRGKPCLGARADATPGLVKDGVTGLLVDDPFSAGQVAEALGRLLSDPEMAGRFGKTGFELVRSTYQFKHFSERFWACLTSEIVPDSTPAIQGRQ